MSKKLLVTAAVVSMLSACGGTAKIGGKDGAAQAVHALSSPSKSAATRASSGVVTTDISAGCEKGGTVKLSGFSATVDMTGGLSVTQTFTMTLDACVVATSSQGDATYTGTFTVSQKVVTTSSAVSVEQHFKGTATVGGAFNDTLDADISEIVALTDVDKNGSVSVVLKGAVTTSSGAYSFDGAVSLTGGSITVASSK